MLEERTLNTNVGNEIENDVTLRRIWSAGSQKFKEERRRREIASQRFFVGLDSTENLTRPSTAKSARVPPTRKPKQQVPRRAKTAQPVRSQKFFKRPFTAIERHVLSDANSEGTAVDVDVEESDDDDDDDVFEKVLAANRNESRSDSPLSKKNVKVTPKSTKPAKVEARKKDRERPKPESESNQEPKLPSFVFEEKKPTLLDLHRDLVKMAKFDERVRCFSARVAPLRNDDQSMSDYYTISLQRQSRESQAQKMTSFAHLSAGVVPPAELRKWMGNTSLKAITMKPLNFDFDRQVSVVTSPLPQTPSC